MTNDTLAVDALAGAVDALKDAAADLTVATALAPCPSLASDATVLAEAIELELLAVLAVLARHARSGGDFGPQPTRRLDSA